MIGMFEGAQTRFCGRKCTEKKFLLIFYLSCRYLIVKYGVDYENKETWRKITTRALLFGFIDPAFGTIPLQYLNYIAHASVIDGGPASRDEPYLCYPENMLLGYIYPAVCFLGFIIPIFTMAYFYWKVYRYTQHHAKSCKVEQLQLNNSTTIHVSAMKVVVTQARGEEQADTTFSLPKSTTRHQRATKILKYLFASLTIFYTPFVIVTFVVLLIMSGATPNLDLEWWTLLLSVTQHFGVINNALNPLLYAYTMPKLHETMVNVWKDLAHWMLTILGSSKKSNKIGGVGGKKLTGHTTITDISVGKILAKNN